jgi:hypothetical protein
VLYLSYDVQGMTLLFSPELDVHFHSQGIEAAFDPMIAVIPFSVIHCHLAQGTLPHANPPQWITIALDKVGLSFYKSLGSELTLTHR